jgi:hypothetical protein
VSVENVKKAQETGKAKDPSTEVPSSKEKSSDVWIDLDGSKRMFDPKMGLWSAPAKKVQKSHYI